MKTLKVKPVEGCMLPLETNPKKYVDREREVPNTAYYRRALARGDIAKASAPTEPASAPKPKKDKKGGSK